MTVEIMFESVNGKTTDHDYGQCICFHEKIIVKAPTSHMQNRVHCQDTFSSLLLLVAVVDKQRLQTKF